MKSALDESRQSALQIEVLQQNWEYGDADTQNLTHNVHRYSGKFIPQIAARAIELLTDPGDLVLDPYVGSGTTLLESALLNRRGIGVDLSPLAVLISKVKTTPVPKSKLVKLVLSQKSALSSLGLRDELPLFGEYAGTKIQDATSDPRLKQEWFQKWFQPHVLSELVQIDLEIARIEEEPLRNIAWVAFSDILRRCSNAHSGYPNVMFDKNAPKKDMPLRPYIRTLERIIDMVSSLSRTNANWSDVRVMNGNATDLPVADESVDAIISHPPYIGSIPYAEYGLLSLQWLGVDPKQLDRELTGGRRQTADVVSRFADSYGNMLKESARVLKAGRHAFLMVGNPVVRGEVVDLANMTCALASSAGLELVVRTERQGLNRRANKMGAEHLLFFRKALKKRKRAKPLLKKHRSQLRAAEQSIRK